MKMAMVRTWTEQSTGYVVIDENYNKIYQGLGSGLGKAVGKENVAKLKAEADIFCSFKTFNPEDWIEYRRTIDPLIKRGARFDS